MTSPRRRPRFPKTRQDLEAAIPDLSSPLRLRGLESAVEVYRDRHGIPHVMAGSVHDAFFGQAFATAQDRLWHMDFDRRRAYGRWAEYAGSPAADHDVLMRRLQIRSSVRADYQALDADARMMLDAYASGVNAFIKTATVLPIEYTIVDGRPEMWEPWDCLAVFKVRHILMGVYEGKVWRARLVSELGAERAAGLLRGYQPGHLLIIPPGAVYDGPVADGLRELNRGAESLRWLREVDAGSNSWAIAGSRTASGKPLLAGDPHRGLDTPNVYYQNHVACPDFDVIGLSFPGFPAFPHFGHNARVAWCITHAQADYQDVYIERFKEGDPRSYEHMGEWRRAEVSHEVVQVRGAPQVELDVTVTHHGPVIVGDPSKGRGLALKYTGTAGPNRGAQSVLRMLMARSVDEMEEAMRGWVEPCNNFMFADVSGNIGYLTRGQVPVRSMANAWLPVPGWTGDHEWQGFIPFEELPRARNPETGYIVTANNRIVGHDYPYYIGLDYAPEYRALRIIERVRGLRGATVQDMANIHAERVSVPAITYSRLLARVRPLEEHSARALATLKGWGGRMDVDAVAPTIYGAFRDRLHAVVMRHLFGDLAEEALSATGRGAPVNLRQVAALLVTMADANDTSLLPPGSDWESLAARALSEGVASLRQRLGDDMGSWQWGKVHHTRPRHTLSDAFPELAPLLDPPSVPAGGDGDTPQAGGYSPLDPFVVTGTSVARYVFDTADWDNSAWITPLGSSGHPGSRHYADQASVWADVRLIPMVYGWREIAAVAESRQALLPG